MNYEETLSKLEPSIKNLKKDYRITYQMPNGKWYTCTKTDSWQTWYVALFLVRDNRLFHVLEISTDTVYKTHLLLLNLFSNRLSGRSVQNEHLR